MRNLSAIIVLILLISLIIAACASAAPVVTTLDPVTTLDGASLVQERCTACHSLDRIQAASYTATGWKSVVDRMISHGAQLTPQEETVVVTWLAAHYGP